MLYPTAFFTNNHVSLHIYKNKLPMKILYYIYQICIALPILLVLTILTAIVTIVGSLLGGAHFWGYYPGKIWSQLICLFLLIPVKIHGREKLHGKTSYIFVPKFIFQQFRYRIIRDPSIFFLFMDSSEEISSG